MKSSGPRYGKGPAPKRGAFRFTRSFYSLPQGAAVFFASASWTTVLYSR